MYSQFGEDEVLKEIFGEKVDFFVDIGAYNGKTFSNTKFFRDNGSKGVMIDSVPKSPEIIKAFVTAENINSVLKENNVPQKFDLLSLDIDGNDYWVWKALTFEPKVVVVEYNPNLEGEKTIDYQPDYVWDRKVLIGSSKLAFEKLAEEKGYILKDYTPANLIFIRK